MVRRNTRPMPFGMAHTWKKRLSIGYAILAWNALGFVLYAAFTGKADWAKSHGLKTQEECEMRPGKSIDKDSFFKKKSPKAKGLFNVFNINLEAL